MSTTTYPSKESTYSSYAERDACIVPIAPGTVPFKIIVVSGALALSGTSSAAPQQLWDSYVWDEDATSSGGGEEQSKALTTAPNSVETSEAVANLRRISGLTWDHLARMFGVSRRSVHFWASGKPLSIENEQHLLAVVDVVRRTDRGSASSNRAALLDGRHGERVYDLLFEKKYEDAYNKLETGVTRPRPKVPLAHEELVARTPTEPAQLVEGAGDHVHKQLGRGRRAKVRRGKGRGTT